MCVTTKCKITNLDFNQMKGKRVFTEEEANQIIRLIRQKNRAESSAQKSIREKIRKLGFYATDFGIQNYDEHDFLRVVTIRSVLKPSDSTCSNPNSAVNTINPGTMRKTHPSQNYDEDQDGSSHTGKKDNEISGRQTSLHVTFSGAKQWRFIQAQSSNILASGLKKLHNVPVVDDLPDVPMTNGNYLISRDSLKYIGESKDLRSRIKQQTVERTSTFYKNYRKYRNKFTTIPQDLTITDFEISCIPTSVGRKELEEFGIVHLPANLNKFQKGKRDRFFGDVDDGLWDDVQQHASVLLEEAEQVITQIEPSSWFQVDAPEGAGLYWVENTSEGLIYIGETSSLLKRWEVHSSKTYFSALRRHIGENILGYKLKVKDGKRRYLLESEDAGVNRFLEKCSVKLFPISFGRFELEEYLIRKYRPLLNRKENK